MLPVSIASPYTFHFFRYVFALNMFELGCINSTEWAVYQDWHSFLVEQFGRQVELEGIIYLRAPPQVLLSRVTHKPYSIS